ncbi:hypothetical protein CF326_g9347 [Tilletia indica]|nr:hypothetical protein CF326_g9347 [Tilletia indica]
MLAELVLKLNLFHHPPPLLLAPVRSRLLPRGDRLINEGIKWFDEAIRVAKDPNVDIETLEGLVRTKWFDEAIRVAKDPNVDIGTLEELVRKGREVVKKLEATIEDLDKDAPPSPPRYDLTPSSPHSNPVSRSRSHVPCPPE